MGIILLVVVACAVIFFVIYNSKKKASNDDQTVPAQPVASKAQSDEISREKKIQTGKKVYSYINGLIKQMFYQYRTDQWESFDEFQVSEQITLKDISEAQEFLGKKESDLLDQLIQGISVEENRVTDPDKLKDTFEKMVLPFYPAYFDVFGDEIRYSAFLNRLTLNLFQQLSGKKFRVGYRNKYTNGTTAFTWNKNYYQVYDEAGVKLCDASFKDGRVYNGFCVESVDSENESEWMIQRAGRWQDGVFQDGELRYHYQKSCQ